MTNFRELCDELLDELKYQTDWSIAEELKERASAALAEPEPEPDGPTDIKIASIFKAYAVVEPQMGISRILHEKHFGNAARAVLARLGSSASAPQPQPQPIPVIKRRPGPEDCDAEGRCWWGAPAYPGLAPASWRFVSAKDRFRSELYWLPAITLPLPQ